MNYLKKGNSTGEGISSRAPVYDELPPHATSMINAESDQTAIEERRKISQIYHFCFWLDCIIYLISLDSITFLGLSICFKRRTEDGYKDYQVIDMHFVE